MAQAGPMHATDIVSRRDAFRSDDGLVEEGVQRLPKRVHNEADVPQLLVVQDVAAIKHECWLHLRCANCATGRLVKE